jgi:alkanesulfonate monooxygenase SsuD/methylene tetrahydromethanopterin reductase-like flavin-dependent oxidoreductase (luciferase family)
MRLGIALPNVQPDGSAPRAAQVAARARMIEDIGFDVIAMGERVAYEPRPSFELLTWMAAVACATRRVELATAIIQVPLRGTVELAHQLLSLHALSGGRFLAGVGAGSTQRDYDAIGIPFEQRFQRFVEAMTTIKRLCDGEQVGTAFLNPWPDARGGPPLLIGAWASGLWVRRAARDYAGWMASGRTTFREISEGIKIFRDNGGKRAMLVTVNINLKVSRARLDPNERFTLNCEPREATDWLQRLEDLGYDDICLTRMGHTEADVTEDDLRQIRALVPRVAPAASS